MELSEFHVSSCQRYLVFSSCDFSVTSCFCRVKCVCVLQNIVTDYLFDRDKLIKTRMKIIPSYATHNLIGKNTNTNNKSCHHKNFWKEYTWECKLSEQTCLSLLNQSMLKKVVCITKTRHLAVSPYICQFKSTTCSANVPFILKQHTYKIPFKKLLTM